jgi:cysteinyl-tRNA synthetase
MKLYNTLSRKKEDFVPLEKGNVKMYCCGPTVYNYAHIGNLRSYIFEDFLKRTLLFNDYKVTHVINITDVGHLTSDADDGEDKMLKGALREKKTVWDIAEFYTQAFQNDVKELNILSPDYWPKATEHINEQIEIVKQLEQKGYTYSSGGNVYFDTSKFKDYGELTNINVDSKARVEKDENKKNSHDFVLWFTKSKFQDQEMKWNSPWGEGYPGWHLECSAMSIKYLGEQFDIHCGGIDHIPVHHTNEIAQSECYTGKKPWVKYWVHGEFLVLKDNVRMGKSEGNFLRLQVLKDKGYDPLDYRYFCLGTHYRKQLMFSFEGLDSARNARKRLVERIISEKGEVVNQELYNNYLENFKDAINDDLNMPVALALLWEVVKDNNLTNYEKFSLAKNFDHVFGLNLGQEEIIPQEIVNLAEERELARKNKDYAQSDKLRELILEKGYVVKDTKDGYNINKG